MGQSVQKACGCSEAEKGSTNLTKIAKTPAPVKRAPPPPGPPVEKKVKACPGLEPQVNIAFHNDGSAQGQATVFPTAKEILSQVLQPKQIFDLAAHEYCCFGKTLPGGKGSGNAVIEPEYDEKTLEISGGASAADMRSALLSMGIAICCKKGKKPEQPNQDNVLFWKNSSMTICGVADGHGADGHWISHWAVRFMLRLLIPEVLASGSAPGDAAWVKIFDTVHQALQFKASDDRFDLKMSGTTFSVCIVDHQNKNVVCAWVGDSRCGVGEPGGVKGQALSQDHKPNDPEEKARIEKKGGEVIKMEGDDEPHRVFIKGQGMPGLAMSRACGDCMAHSVGVTHVPSISRGNLKDHFVLCCSDGVWEFIECDEAGEMVSSIGRAQVIDAAEKLTLESRNHWLEEDDLTDDISAICIWL